MTALEKLRFKRLENKVKQLEANLEKLVDLLNRENIKYNKKSKTLYGYNFQ